MWYKQYGRLPLEVSAIGFGGMRFPRVTADRPEYDLDACAALVLEARRLGVNYFDTAPFYCDDQSELIMGHAFRQMKAGGLGAPGLAAPAGQAGPDGQALRPVYVSTKSGEHDGERLREQLERSLTRLGVERVDFFNIWCIMDLEDYRKRLAKGGAYEAALKARDEGLIGHVVCSSHCNGAEIATIAREGLFEGITIGYNILNYRFRQEGLQAAHAAGMGVVTMNPLGGGMVVSRARDLDFVRTPADTSVVDAALRFNAAHQEITVTLAGMGSLEQVRQNARVGTVMGTEASGPEAVDHEAFARARRQELAAGMGASMDNLCTGCQYCLPCPREVPIPKYLMAYNHRLFGLPADAQNELKWHWHIGQEGAGDCVGCGECEARCTQHLPIIGRLQEISGWPQPG